MNRRSMSKDDLLRKIAACDTELAEIKGQIRRLEIRLGEVEHLLKEYLDRLEHGDYSAG